MMGLHPFLQNKKAVLFDLDGTLMDSMGVWADIDRVFLGERGYVQTEEEKAAMQRDIEGKSFTETAVYFKSKFSLEEDLDTIKGIWTDMALEAYRHQVPMKKGVGLFLEYLKENGFCMAVASSNAYALIDAALRGNGIRDYFQTIVISCEVPKGKPAPDVYLEAARRLQVPPEECVVFEDITAGILAGKSAGMQTCAVWDAYSLEQEAQKQEMADFYIMDFFSLLPNGADYINED